MNPGDVFLHLPSRNLVTVEFVAEDGRAWCHWFDVYSCEKAFFERGELLFWLAGQWPRE